MKTTCDYEEIFALTLEELTGSYGPQDFEANLWTLTGRLQFDSDMMYTIIGLTDDKKVRIRVNGRVLCCDECGAPIGESVTDHSDSCSANPKNEVKDGNIPSAP